MTAAPETAKLQVFALPDLGEGLTEAELVSWLVAEGDAVAVDQPIAEVETAKSVVEVPSPFAGTVAVLHGKPGEVLEVGAPFLSVRPEGMESADGPGAAGSDGSDDAQAAGGVAPGSEDPAVLTAAATVREEAGVPTAATQANDDPPVAAEGSGNVLIGYGTPGGLTGGRTRPRKRMASSAAASRISAEPSPQIRRAIQPQTGMTSPELGTVDAGADAAPGSDVEPASGRRSPSDLVAPLCISPLVRRLARENGVRLVDVDGSGDQGLILRRDVVEAISASATDSADFMDAPASVEALDAGTSGSAESAGVPGSEPAADTRSGLAVLERTPLRGVRRTIADAMTRSRREIPEATVWVDVDVTALVELREGMKRRTPDAVPGILAFVARFVVAGLARYPELNSRIATGDDGTQELIRVDGVNLGIAAQTDRGLVVPSVRRADTMSARELDAEIRRLAAVAREGRATPTDLSSGTFTLNNYGVFGVDGSAAIINYPESAILGMGRIMDRPWVVDGQLAVRKITELTLAFDHRVCDGGTAGGFLRFVADAMENPGGMLAEL
ncbi:2-oxo acid dehydrogenase subunit E2 [Arthrobacter echini]|uniref:Dihydrolipoamide acetyltransferase component of pyruvate dehydrogenase complex n=1 Tax=Arthrobacter echini TaxID=1529066 RepID=A0A4S5E9G3_9MICC|nr:dihydrolipoamide acetyltransferase family protein [Arthrobacter echini]THJ68347.1 2-oxo acid dehydrogenase subunit E2 [Arthrobacter echini]